MSAAACPFCRCFFLDDLMLMTRYLYIEHLISTDIDIQVTLEKKLFPQWYTRRCLVSRSSICELHGCVCYL